MTLPAASTGVPPVDGSPDGWLPQLAGNYVALDFCALRVRKNPMLLIELAGILDKLTGVSGDGFLLRCRYCEIRLGVVSAAPKPSPIDFAACVSARKPKFTSRNHRCLAGCPSCPAFPIPFA